MKESQHRVVPLFSDEDADLLKYKWYRTAGGYARRTGYARKEEGGPVVKVPVLFHRVVLSRVLSRPLRPGEFVDHINRNRLDNRRENLRVVTLLENARNRSPFGKSGYRGVTKHHGGRWRAKVQVGGKCYYCGLHETAEEAGRAAADKRRELGFPEAPE